MVDQPSSAEIRGSKWSDLDGDRIWDSDEPALAGWTIFLDTNQNGYLDVEEVRTTTDAAGGYVFTGLAPGTYSIGEVLEPGWIQKFPVPIAGGNSAAMEAMAASEAPAVLPAITTTGSMAPMYVDGGPAASASSQDPSPVNGEAGFLPADAQSSALIGLDQFRADPRFAGVDGRGETVAILDTGVDLNHPFFGPDYDGNGVADRIVYQYDFADNDNDASDRDGHGSNVASIVASQDGAYPGVAPGVDLVCLKVFSDSGGGSFSSTEKALQWVVANAAAYNIVGVNMSLGDSGNYTSPQSLYGLGDELAALAAMNVIVSSSSGNGFYTFSSAPGVAYPSADPHSLSIGAVYDSDIGAASYKSGATAYSTGADRITPFSQRHPTMTTVLAPGAAITGANQSGGTVVLQGTSQAAPHITGIAALAQQLAVQRLGRRLSVDEFRALLTSTAITINDGDDEDDNVVNTRLDFPRVDAFRLADAILAIVPPSALNTVSVEAGQVVESVNFGNQPLPGGLSGSVWNDANGNRSWDAGEPALEGWAIFLDANQNGQWDTGEASTATDRSGHYAFTGLAPGEYTVAETVLPDWQPTYPSGSPLQAVTIGPGQSVTRVNFGNQAIPGQIVGNLWHDRDGDGARDEGESGLAGRLVFLDGDDNGDFDPGEPYAFTDGDGVYRFAGLKAGSYSLACSAPAGWEVTAPLEAPPWVVAVSPGQVAPGIHFGLYDLPASIHGSQWDDLNRDGVRDDNEPGLAGRTVFLDANGNGLLDPGETTGTTDDDGDYTLAPVRPGIQTVVEVRAGDEEQTFPFRPAVERLALAYNRAQGNASSSRPQLSADGRYVAFQSDASNLVPRDTNQATDIFVYDRRIGLLERVSVAGDGAQADAASAAAAISADGRYVAFQSDASNLVPGDTNGFQDIFVFDRQDRTTQRVSLTWDGEQANATSDQPAISAGGRFLVFQSLASNLVPGDTNGESDVFLYDRQSGQIERVSLAPDGSQANEESQRPRVSDDGRFVAFESLANNLAGGDTNGLRDIFVYDRQIHAAERVSLAGDGAEPNGASDSPALSGDGRFVVFRSAASNLVPSDTNTVQDVFVYDRQTRAVELASAAVDGSPGNQGSHWPAISFDGAYVAYHSYAANLVTGDTNGAADIFGMSSPFAWVRGTYPLTLAAGQAVIGVDFGNHKIGYDYGDAPGPLYPTLASQDGARHRIISGFFLGSRVDAEGDGQPAADAGGDDVHGPLNDEDGVQFTSLLVPGEAATIKVTASAEGKLDAWIDFDGDGSWTQAADQVFAAQPLVAGVNTLNVTVPDAAAASGKTFARFRFSSAGGLSFTGPAMDGEVEDYQVVVQPPVFRETTAGDSVSFSTDGTTHTVIVNGATKIFDAGIVSLIRFDGLAGNDAIVVRGGPGDETATLGENFGTITGPGYTLIFTSVEQVSIDAGPGSNQAATIEDGDANDTFYGAYDAAKGSLRASMYYAGTGAVSVWGFQSVEGRHLHRGNDQAMLIDGPGDDTFTGRPGDASFQYAAGGAIRAVGFPSVYANAIAASSDSNDRVDLYDSADADQYIATPSLARIKYNGGAAGMVFTSGFNVVQAHATAGGNDAAQYYDSAANDTFTADAAARFSSMTDGAGYHNSSEGFKNVYAWSSGGTDLADIRGTTATDTIVAALRPLPGSSTSTSYAYLLASASQAYAYNFAHLKVDAIQGAVEKIQVLDSPEADLVEVSPAQVKLSSQAASGPLAGRWIEVNNISSVYVTGGSGAGRDSAVLTDSAGNDTFWSQPRDAHIAYGTGPFVDLKGVAEVTAGGGTGTAKDVAYLYDSATAGTNDTLVAGPRSARMTDAGGTCVNMANGFASLFAYSRSGQDTATLAGSSGNDALTVVPGGYAGSAGQASAIYKYQGGDQAVAFGFRAVEANGGTAGTSDIAYLLDSPGDDIARLGQAVQTMETTGDGARVYARTTGFDQVYAKAYHGGRDQALFEDSAGSNFFFGSSVWSYLYYGSQLNEADAFEVVDAAFSGGGDQVKLVGSPFTAESLSNTGRNDLVLEDSGPSAAYWIYLHGLDHQANVQEARLQKNKDGTDQDSSTVGNPTAVDYLFRLVWEQL